MDNYIRRFSNMMESDASTQKIREMRNHFFGRTRSHIRRVQGFIDIAREFFPSLDSELREREKHHDESKFYQPELEPYILLTWMYKLKKNNEVDPDFILTDEDNKKITEVTFLHCKKNKHHPEYWDNNLSSNPINSKDRDKPSGIIVDGTKMDKVSIIEMVCDWCSMSKELGESGPTNWANNNIGKRWRFSNEQTDFIYELVDLLWK